ncbi:hypothetical protein [Microbacterium sp. KR10-403]|uniref:hypothetical protein n=1 Tax=Microbacterium sp. KR10-403 TaxID=3158581 RepID=UPI0032E3859C
MSKLPLILGTLTLAVGLTAGLAFTSSPAQAATTQTVVKTATQASLQGKATELWKKVDAKAKAEGLYDRGTRTDSVWQKRAHELALQFSNSAAFRGSDWTATVGTTMSYGEDFLGFGVIVYHVSGGKQLFTNMACAGHGAASCN